jgi:hypothetical protein
MQAIWMRLNLWALDKPVHIDTAPYITGANASSCNHTGQVSGLRTRLPQPHYAPSSERQVPKRDLKVLLPLQVTLSVLCNLAKLPQIKGYFETETLPTLYMA